MSKKAAVRIIPRATEGIVCIRFGDRGQWQVPTITREAFSDRGSAAVSDRLRATTGLIVHPAALQPQISGEDIYFDLLITDVNLTTNVVSRTSENQVYVVLYERARHPQRGNCIAKSDREFLQRYQLLVPPEVHLF